MIRSVFISSAEPYSGKSMITLGVFETILRKTQNVAFFKPIIRDQNGSDQDKNIELILKRYGLSQSYEDSYVFHRKEALSLLAHGNEGKFIDKVIDKYKNLEKNHDFIVCEGSDYIGEGSYHEFDINSLVAKHLGLPTLVIGLGKGRSLKEILNPIEMTVEAFHKQETRILGVIVNQVFEGRESLILDGLNKELTTNTGFHSVIPYNKVMSSPTLNEIAQQLGAKVLFGGDKLGNLAMDFQTVAMHLDHYFEVMKEGCVAITPRDRIDILMGALQANLSKNLPNISGIILTGGAEPPKQVTRLLSGLTDVLPVLGMDDYTFDTSVKANNVTSSITYQSKRKINIALELFDRNVDLDGFFEQVHIDQPTSMTPKMFIYHIQALAKQKRKRIVLPEGDDDRILKAIEILQQKDVVDMVVLGDPDQIQSRCSILGLDIDFNKTEIINPAKSKQFKKYAKELFEIRKNKGVNLEMAEDLICDVSYFGTMMVHKGHADGMVSGASHTTQHTIRPALQFIKTKPGYKVVSSVFFMCLDDRVLCYGDCAINPNPTSEQLAEIAASSAETCLQFGIEPRVAMLSYSSGASGKGADVEQVREATNIVKDRYSHIKVEGPIQYDAAVDELVGKKKMPESEVAGNASVLIFPNLNTGNNTYKAVQRETGAIAIGPVLQGLNKPVNDLSRGCLVEDIVNTVIITAIQAQQVTN